MGRPCVECTTRQPCTFCVYYLLTYRDSGRSIWERVQWILRQHTEGNL